jgi:hypothetical protein
MHYGWKGIEECGRVCISAFSTPPNKQYPVFGVVIMRKKKNDVCPLLFFRVNGVIDIPALRYSSWIVIL